MSASNKESKQNQKWELSGSWSGAWKIAAAVGVVGLLASGAGYASDPRRFAFSWLFAFVTVLTVALGALFFVIVQHLTAAGWSVTVRRTAEFFSSGIVILIPLFVPVLLFMGQLFPWADGHGGHGAGPEHGEHGAEHGLLDTFVKPAFAQTAPAAEAAQAPEAAPTAAAAESAKAPEATPAAEGSAHEATAAEHAAPAEAPEHAAPAEPHAPRALGVPGGHLGRGHHALAHGASDPVAAGLPDPNELAHHEVLAKKTGYLNRSFFYGRAAFYFIVWSLLALRFFGYSTSQDGSKDPKFTLKSQRLAPAATFLYGLTLTFAAFDWIMSLEPSWFSTIFGVYIFAGGVVGSYAVLILVTMSLRKAGPLANAFTIEHYHDLGKLMFGFIVFWAYIGFAQFMLIWYAALPEETTFYHNRWDHGPWAAISLFLLVGHFVVPFFWLISRNFKRVLGRLQLGALAVLVMHVVDIYWLVMPNFALGSDSFSFHWLDATCLLAVGGLYCAFVFFRMTKFPLVPVGDPRLQRSLHFQNA